MLETFHILNLDYRLIVRNIKGLRHRFEKIYKSKNQSLWQEFSVHVFDLRCLESGLQAIVLSLETCLLYLMHLFLKLFYIPFKVICYPNNMLNRML